MAVGIGTQQQHKSGSFAIDVKIAESSGNPLLLPLYGLFLGEL